ncbi:S1C family serine protease [Actinacidiphila alni]|uniref:S1C family serine protease n=1 Tax=Actinacidiphila alni TaxID=380248 RepID=UPI003452BE86
MTESSRNGEPHQYPSDPQLPFSSEPDTAVQPVQPVHRAPDFDAPSATGFPPPPPYEPGTGAVATAAEPPGEPVPAGRRRARRPVALFAAVALAAGVIGGGAGALIGNATHDSGSGTTASTAVNASVVDGSVSSVAKAVSPSVVEINATSSEGKSTGAGVIITSDGEVITNNHVIAGADSVSVTYSNGKKATASVVGTDSAKDLALIKVQGASGLPAATLGDSSKIAVGDQVVAIGSPEGLTGTVTSGIVSSLNRDVTVSTDESQGQGQGQGGNGQWPFSFGGNQYNGDTGSSTTTYKAIQTDASLNPGNSGGALINMSGQIIGINSAMYSDASSSGGSSSAGSVGLGFAIPIDTVKSDLAKLRAGGTSDNSNSDSGNGNGSSDGNSGNGDSSGGFGGF